MYQQPWLLVLVAFCCFLAIGTFRCVFPDKLRLFQWIIPAVIACAGVGLDYFIQTDLEKIRTVLDTLLESAQIEDVDAIDHLIASDYLDSYHASKIKLINHLHTRFAHPVFEKITRLSRTVGAIENAHAVAILNLACVFDKDSDVAKAYRDKLMAGVRLDLSQQQDGEWKISRIELVEVDKQPVNWRAATSQF